MNKKQQKAAAKAAYSQSRLVKLDGVEHYDIYVKRYTLAEAVEVADKHKEIESQHEGDKFIAERRLAVELFDEDGGHYFDPEDLEDLELISMMPMGLRVYLAEKIQEVIYGDTQKKR